MTPPAMDTERLSLRPLRIGDADALHPVYSDVAAQTYAAGPATATLAETRKRVAQSVADKHWRSWAIRFQGDDQPVGAIACCEERQGKVTEIGYMLNRAFWGRGIATEAATALIDLLFAEGQRRVFADTDPDNAASIRVVERLGFTLEARLRADWETHIGVRDSLIFGLLADEWRARRGELPLAVGEPRC